ncbi:hypothetical protein OIU78_009044 [Salix suchowensis]|nr:hypothetical protein OIU78_009044 [Salix suchowensis]
MIWAHHPSGKFTIKSAWELMRDKKPENCTHKLLWFTSNIPRHAFILWLAVQGRLRTMDRAYRDTEGATCTLCESEMESHDHLFFKCNYSTTVWMNINLKVQLQWRNADWADFIKWAAQDWGKKNNFRHLTACLVLSSTVYFLWYERNRRIFREEAHSPSSLTEEIFQLLRTHLANLEKAYQIDDRERLIWGL